MRVDAAQGKTNHRTFGRARPLHQSCDPYRPVTLHPLPPACLVGRPPIDRIQSAHGRRRQGCEAEGAPVVGGGRHPVLLRLRPSRPAAATKRKERAASAAPSGSPLPKRQAPEREPVDPPSLLPPQPRSRQPTRKLWRKPAHKKSTHRSVKPPRAQEEGGPPPPPALLPPRPSLEKEIEAVLSCGAGVHVVPTFAALYSLNPIGDDGWCLLDCPWDLSY